MAATFTEVSLKDMERFLKRGFRFLHPRKGEEKREVYIDLSLSDNVAIRVWTSIAVGRSQGANVGQDAIRVQLISKPLRRPLMKGKAPIVKRTQNWRSNLQARIEDYIEAYEDKEDYWEGRASGGRGQAPAPKDDRPPPPDGKSGPPPTDAQVGFVMKLVPKAPDSFNWTQYGFDRAPDEEGVRKLSRRSVSNLIEALKAAAPSPGQPRETGAPSSGDTATFTKLRDGSWGIRGMNLVSGTWVTVIKRSGQKSKVQVGEVVWAGRDGTTVARIGGNRRFAEDLGLDEMDMGEPTSSFDYYGDLPQ